MVDLGAYANPLAQRGADHHAARPLLNICRRKHAVANEGCYKTGSRPVI